MGKIKKNEEKLSRRELKTLQVIIEDVLEEDTEPFISGMKAWKKSAGRLFHSDRERFLLTRQKYDLFLHSLSRPWPIVEPIGKANEADSPDIIYGQITEGHRFLRSLWQNLKEAIFDIKSWEPLDDRWTLNIHTYGSSSLRVIDNYWMMPVPRMKGEMKEIGISFRKKAIDFPDVPPYSYALLGRLRDLLDGVPLEYFEQCENCKKCIIITRKGKRYCLGCAAKAGQKKKWREDPEGCREKERLRYHEKRKKRVVT